LPIGLDPAKSKQENVVAGITIWVKLKANQRKKRPIRGKLREGGDFPVSDENHRISA